ncbi:RNA polymerase sigma factor [Bradyrhizobium cenepequi]|uniref:RNA polymerase sigma factor n=1 Tax=Bradyrhizobium cenepequi TaxID=2821403 RepID=UPI001CE2E594|nr:RNA polymerase sigma factor [Bradyrhizobium cenepequi]MCA6109658.1 RNA polymerase sigma factor [Bradyrhizobium cenepequi]
MSDSGRNILRHRFLIDYDEIKTRLSRRLGSVDQASDALQETWIRLEETSQIGAVERPRPYLLRIAYHLSLKRRAVEREAVTLDEARAALDLVDEAPDPARVAEARSELRALDEALAELTPRRREILLASRVEGVPLSEIATRYGLSQRMIEKELKLALIHCGRRLGRNIVQRFGPGVSKGSSKKTDS